MVSTVGPPETPIPTPTLPLPPTADPLRYPAPLTKPTPRPTPESANDTLPELRRDVDLEVAVKRALNAYAYCNGLYFGYEAEQRHEAALKAIESGTRTLREVQDDVRNICSSNFNNPRVNLPAPTATPAPTPTPDPREEDATPFERRQHLVQLLNERREALELPPFRSSGSAAAQIHADRARNTCAASLWHTNGETIHHLYHREGGSQDFFVYHAGQTRCASRVPNSLPTWKEEAADVVAAIEALPDKPLEDPDLVAAAIGAAWTPAQRWLTVILEADRGSFEGRTYETEGDRPVKLQALRPDFTRGKARIAAWLAGDDTPNNLIARIYHVPDAGDLTRAQINAVSVHAPGNLIAVAVPVANYVEDATDEPGAVPQPSPSQQDGSAPLTADTPDCFSTVQADDANAARPSFVICRGAWTTPYDVPAQTAPTATAVSAVEIHLGNRPGIPVQVRQMLASELAVLQTADGPDLLSVSVNTHSLQDFHGPGVYTLEVWGILDGEPTLLVAGSHRQLP